LSVKLEEETIWLTLNQSDLFGFKQNDKLKSVIGTIYQTFDKKDIMINIITNLLKD